MSSLLFFLPAAVVVWLLYRQHRAKADRLRRLALEGVGIDAQITRRFERPLPKSRKVPYIEYRFETAAGDVLVQKQRVTRARYQEVKSGDPIAVVYDPDDPAWNKPRTYLMDKGYL